MTQLEQNLSKVVKALKLFLIYGSGSTYRAFYSKGLTINENEIDCQTYEKKIKIVQKCDSKIYLVLQNDQKGEYYDFYFNEVNEKNLNPSFDLTTFLNCLQNENIQIKWSEISNLKPEEIAIISKTNLSPVIYNKNQNQYYLYKN